MATQQDREMGVTTPLGEDVLVLRGMTGSEELGRMFEYQLSLVSDDHSIKAKDILGQNVTIRLDLADDKKRYFNGFVSRFAQSGRSPTHASYQATIRPWLWFLTRRADCRIFQDMTVPEIVKKVFRDDGFTDFDESLSGTYDKWTYCVQYRETDFNFVSRLLEQEGIYYYFKHEDGKHTLMLCDSSGAHSALPGNEEVAYNPAPGNVHADCIYDWATTQEVLPGVYSLQDFDFEKPSVDLAAKSTLERDHANAAFEIYDYPGEYLEEQGGKGYAKARIEELQCHYEKIAGAGTVRGFYPGGLFKLIDYPRDDQNREYLVVSANHDLQSSEFQTGASSGGPNSCVCGFSAIESKTPYRAPRVTPKPIIQGPQTAIVVGPSGEEIYTDKYGRVKVQFHWDRLGKKDENSSCWIRVAQVWAGQNWGGIQIPRIGQEVMVEFLEGDPDQPIITGRVYNAEQMPPYGLPDNATQSGIKSRSSKGGNDANFNEIRMEDKKGSEELYIHAEKNHTNITEADRSEDVGHDRSLHVGHDKSESIDNNKTITVGVDHTEKIGANEKVDVGANRTHTVGANHTETVGANMDITVGSNLTENVAIAYAENVGAAMAINVGAAMAIDVGAAMSTNVGAVNSLTVGASNSKTVGSDDKEEVGGGKTVTVAKDLGETISGGHTHTVTKDYALKAKKISLEAEDEITIKTGDATISMKKDGTITVKGKDITIQGSGKIGVKADGDLTLKGSKIGEN
jgi:type VI secretion system secreted protein VgrG